MRRTTGKEISKKMMKSTTMKPFAAKVSKMAKVTREDLEEMLPDYVSGGDITDLFSDIKESVEIINFMPSFEEFLNEKKQLSESRISAPSAGFKRSDIESYLKKNKDIAFFANGLELYIPSYMHKNGKLEDADTTSFFAIDKDGEEFEVKFKDIEFIED